MDDVVRPVRSWITASAHVLGSIILLCAVVLGVSGALGAVLSLVIGERQGFWVPLGIASFLLGMCLLVVMHFALTSVYRQPRSSRRPLPGLRKLGE